MPPSPVQVVAVDWDLEYIAANNQLAACEGWGARDFVMCPESADGSALGLHSIEHAIRFGAHKSFPMAAGNTAVLSESANDTQPQVISVFSRPFLSSR